MSKSPRYGNSMRLPHKVWADCIRCPKHDACDEIAMLIEFEDIETIEAPTPPSAKGLPVTLGGYEVPVRKR